jgi:integrase
VTEDAGGGRALDGIGPGLHDPVRHADPPRNFQRFFQARAAKADVSVMPVLATRRTCVSLLVAPHVHRRVTVTILKHSKVVVTMDIYSQVSSTSTKEALKRLGNEFQEAVL